MLTMTGLDQMMAKLKKHELLMKGKIAATKRKLVTDIFTDLVKGSPQWSGNLASNWYIEFHGIKGNYDPIAGYSQSEWRRDDPYNLGDDPAVSATLQRELPKVAQIKWNSNVRLVNYTPYATEVEAGQGPNGRDIRPENYKYGQIAMVAYAMTKYGALRTLKRRV